MGLKKTVAVNLNRLFKNHTYTSKHGLAKGLRRRGGLAFLPAFIPRSTEMLKEEVFIASLDLTGKTVYDIGGDQGIYTLFFARKVGPKGKVFTFEPNPFSYSHIMTNVELNDFTHVEVRNLALGESQGELTFAFPARDPGRGTADPLIRDQILREAGAKSITISVGTVDSLIADGLPIPDFCKIDVEGLELNVLRGMKQALTHHRPDLFIEIHGADMAAKTANIRQVGAFILDHGYQIFHVESEQNLTAATIERAREGHIYCTN
jgi:FkbM family methyltransferase